MPHIPAGAFAGGRRAAGSSPPSSCVIVAEAEDDVRCGGRGGLPERGREGGGGYWLEIPEVDSSILETGRAGPDVTNKGQSRTLRCRWRSMD